MKIIRPVALTSAMLPANSATNVDADYVPATAYSGGVKVSYNDRIYLSLQAANTGHTPGDTASVAWWSDQGPTNKAAMLDGLVNTRTTATTTLAMTVAPVISVNAVSLINLAGVRYAEVIATRDATTLYSKTVDFWDTSLITDWAEYFFAEAELVPDLVLTDLPFLPGMSISITLTGTGTVGLGKLDVGNVLDVGLEEYGLKREGIDYTKVTFDNFGVATIGTQIYTRKFSSQALIENSKLDMITRRLDSLASTPVVIIGANGWKSSMIVYGLLSYSIDLALFSHSYVTFDAKGLV